MKIRLFIASLALLFCGCAAQNPTATKVANATPTTPYGTASKVGYDVSVLVGQAADSADQARISGLITVTEEKTVLGWASALNSFDAQYMTCVQTAHAASGKAAAFIGCASTFSQAAANPQFLTTIRISNPSSQAKVTGYASLINSSISAVISTLQSLQAQGQ